MKFRKENKDNLKYISKCLWNNPNGFSPQEYSDSYVLFSPLFPFFSLSKHHDTLIASIDKCLSIWLSLDKKTDTVTILFNVNIHIFL